MRRRREEREGGREGPEEKGGGERRVRVGLVSPVRVVVLLLRVRERG